MSLLFETIRISDGEARHLRWHERRMNHARQELWNIQEPVNLEDFIKIPFEYMKGLVRCNVYYGPAIESVTY